MHGKHLAVAGRYKGFIHWGETILRGEEWEVDISVQRGRYDIVRRLGVAFV